MDNSDIQKHGSGATAIRKKIALIGCGAIGKVIAEAIDQGQAGRCVLGGVLDLDRRRAEEFASGLLHVPPVYTSFSALLENESELIIEAASQHAVREYGSEILEAGKDLMIMSVGALVDPDLFRILRQIALREDRKIFLPSGAICGLDGVKSASQAKVNRVTLTTTKHPRSFLGVEYLTGRGIDPREIDTVTVLYEGSAREAARLFPFNINVAAALAIAGIGPEMTKVRIIADPDVKDNIHSIEVDGDFGSLTAETRNILSPDNPKTSYLAALSAVATLRKVTDPIQIGT